MSKYDCKSNEELICELRSIVDELEGRIVKKESNNLKDDVVDEKKGVDSSDELFDLIDSMYDSIMYDSMTESDEVKVDPLYEDVKAFAKEVGKISTSTIQRKFSLGYNRANRILDMLEENHLIGPAYGSKPREYIGD